MTFDSVTLNVENVLSSCKVNPGRKVQERWSDRAAHRYREVSVVLIEYTLFAILYF